jgi:hypothetical protein
MGAYPDCFELYDRANAEPAGVRMPISMSETDAKMFQLRMNTARRLFRDKSKQIYPPDHHLYNASPYDHLAVRIRVSAAGIWYAYVEPHGVGHLLQFIEPIEPDHTAAAQLNLPAPEPADANTITQDLE